MIGRKPSAFVPKDRIWGVVLVGGISVIVATTVAGCSSARMVTSEQSQSPTTVQAYRPPPLSLPPDYGERPEPKAARSSGGSSPETRSRSPSVQEPKAGNLSPGTAALLRAADASKALPNIDRLIMQETTIVTREDPSFVDKLIFGKETYSEGETSEPQIALEQEQGALNGF